MKETTARRFLVMIVAILAILVVAMLYACDITQTVEGEDESTTPTDPGSITIIPPDDSGKCIPSFDWIQTVQSLNVQFRNQSQPTEFCQSFRWEFGDGLGTSSEANPTHGYIEPGDYIVQLTACPTDVLTENCSDTSQTVIVQPVNQ